MTGATQAILLVGGQGSRLRPLTVRTAKPMLPVGGVPFLTHQLARLRDAGVTHVVLATSYRAETFVAHFGDGSPLGLRIDYVPEDEPLGTGGAIRNAAAHLERGPDDPVVVLNGDILSGHDIAGQVAMHTGRGADVTLHLVEVGDARAYGCVPTDGDGLVTAFLEKTPDPVTNQVNAGCYVFRSGAIAAIPAGEVVSVERETFPRLLRGGSTVLGWVEQSYWLDVGTPAALVQGSCDLVRGRIRSSALPGAPGDRLVLPGASVAADAFVAGGSVVGAGARVGAGAVVDGCVVMAGAHVGAGAVLRRSVLGTDARVGERAVVDGAVVGDGARVGARNELVAGARVWCDAVIPDGALRFRTDG